MTEPVQKRLTVTFKDVAVQVASLGEDYGSTVASVIMGLIPSVGKTKLQPRVSLRLVSRMCLHQIREANLAQ
jgi:hypothetical protein